MKIVIFTPAAKINPIGGMSCAVLRALMLQGHEVIIVRTESDIQLQSPVHDFARDIIPWNDAVSVKQAVTNADILFYQIDNNYEFHVGAIEWLPYFPGIVCLQDFFLGNLFYAWARLHPKKALAICDNDEVVKSCLSKLSLPEFIEATKDISPLTEFVCAHALGVLAHSSWGIQRVLRVCRGPVHVTPFAYQSQFVVNQPLSFYIDKVEFNVLTLGAINTHQRVAAVMRAIANHRLLQHQTIYHLVGLVEPEMVTRLSSLAQRLNVNLKICGDLAADFLAEAIQGADVICFLDWPVGTEAFTNLIQAMHYGKAIIVNDIGFYRDLPAHCVKKISLENEIVDIQAALVDFYRDMHLRFSIGNAARNWVLTALSAENYANKMLDIAYAASSSFPILKAINYLKTLQHSWGSDDVLLPHSHKIESLLSW